MNTTHTQLALALCLLSPLAVSSVEAQTPVDRLHRADVETSLDAKDMRPWHLKASFEIFGANKEVTNSGLIEE